MLIEALEGQLWNETPPDTARHKIPKYIPIYSNGSQVMMESFVMHKNTLDHVSSSSHALREGRARHVPSLQALAKIPHGIACRQESQLGNAGDVMHWK